MVDYQAAYPAPTQQHRWLHNCGNPTKRTYGGGIRLFKAAGVIASKRGMCRPVLVMKNYFIHVSWTCESFKKSRTLKLLILPYDALPMNNREFVYEPIR